MQHMHTYKAYICGGAAQSHHLQGAQVVVASATVFTVTCFDESDSELRDVAVYPTTKWQAMQDTITETLGAQVCARPVCGGQRREEALNRARGAAGGGFARLSGGRMRARARAYVPEPSDLGRGMVVTDAQAMFAYDDGTGIDFPVRNEAVCV